MIDAAGVRGSARDVAASIEMQCRGLDARWIINSLRKNVRPMVERAKSILARHRFTGTLEKAITISSGAPRRFTGQVAVGIGRIERQITVQDRRTGHSVIRKVVPWRYGKFLEFGFRHTSRIVKAPRGILRRMMRVSANVKQIAPDPFMGPAFDQTHDQIVAGVFDDANRELGR